MNVISPIITEAIRKVKSQQASQQTTPQSSLSGYSDIIDLEKQIKDIEKMMDFEWQIATSSASDKSMKEAAQSKIIDLRAKQASLKAELDKKNKEFSTINISPVWALLSTVSGAASGYHGYKRNKSVGWAVGWFLLGSIFPVITPTIALAQGFGKPREDLKNKDN